MSDKQIAGRQGLLPPPVETATNILGKGLRAEKRQNLFEIAHPFSCLWCDTNDWNRDTSGENTDLGGEKRPGSVMIIRLVEKERYSITPPASSHQHDCRILETKDNRIRIKLDRTMGIRPPFFTVYDLSVRKPRPPPIKVDGKVNWGFGLTWKKAIARLTRQLSPTVVN